METSATKTDLREIDADIRKIFDASTRRITIIFALMMAHVAVGVLLGYELALR